MTTSSDSGQESSHNTWVEREEVLRRFADAWRRGSPPRLADFVPADAVHRQDLLVELALLDLGHRLEAGEAVRIESYCREYPELAADHQRVLALLAAEFECRRRREPDLTLAEYRERFPEHAEAISSLFQTHQGFSREPTRTPVRIDLDALPLALRVPPPGYEFMGLLGRGGMGVVFKARQVRLNRVVALKRILGGGAAGAEEIDRFRIEVEAAAQLQHPNIVQVYEVGDHDGVPYVALEYVAGGTLREALGGRPQSPRAAASLLLTLARTMEYAHGQGIIHRDLKPANILLTRPVVATLSESKTRLLQSREIELPLPKVTDFGLAKRLDSNCAQTRTGAVLGTPCYMAPEQAAGRSRDISPATDVYALGAILYEVLTGQPPFEGQTPQETLDQVREREAARPSRLVKNLPRDLETICLKCLEKPPSARYSSAGELAADLQRFLEHLPIQARRVGTLGRVSRWCRREPKVASLIFVFVLVLGLGLLAASGLWWRAARQAEVHLEESLADVERGLAFVGNEEFGLMPQMDMVRRQFLEQLALKCQGLLEQYGHQPALRLRVADVDHHLGTIYELLGQHQAAESAYRSAILLHTDPGSRDLGRLHYSLGRLLVNVGRLDEAEQQFHQGMLLQAGEDNERRADRALTLQQWAQLHILVGRSGEGDKAYRQALSLQQRLAAEAPAVAAYQSALAQTETGLAILLTNLSSIKEAESLFTAAVSRQEALSAAAPAMPLYRLGLARTLAGQARLYELTGNNREAGKRWVRSYELMKKLAEDSPHRPDYRLEQTAVQHNLARFVNDTSSPIGVIKDTSMLEAQYRQAVADQERLVAEFPAVVEYQRQLALSLNTLATWVNDTATFPGDDPRTIQRIREAEEFHLRSEAAWKQLVAKHPQVTTYQMGLALSHQRFGIVLERQKHYADAEDRYRQALPVVEKLAGRSPQVAGYWVTLAALNNNLGVIQDRNGNLALAERTFQTASEAARRALMLNSQHPASQHILQRAMRNQATVLVRQNRYHQAAEIARQFAVQDPPVPLQACHWVLEFLHGCVELAAADPTLTPAEQKQRTDVYGDWTMSLLIDLTARGLTAAFLESESSLDHVRERPDFQKLKMELRERETRP